MSKFTAEEVQNYRNIVGMLMHGDAKAKVLCDENLRNTLGAMKGAMPLANDDVLAEFASSIGWLAAIALKTSTQDVGALLQRLFDNYSLATALLIGAYDPDAKEVPDYDAPKTETPNLNDTGGQYL